MMDKFLRNKDGEFKIDQESTSSPTYAKDLLMAIKKLIAANKKGVFHITNSGTATRYMVAKKMLDVARLNCKLVPVKADFFDSKGYINTGGLVSKSIKLRPWTQALEEYLREEWL